MTVQGKLMTMLEKMGMSTSQALEVMKVAKPTIDDLVSDYKISFTNSSDAYPNAIYNTLIMLIKPIALQWIEENKPQAWFKPMFQ